MPIHGHMYRRLDTVSGSLYVPSCQVFCTCEADALRLAVGGRGVDVSYEEKGTWVYLVVAVVAYLGYLVVVLSRADGGPVTAVGYVAPMLWAIGISMLLVALGRPAVEVVRRSESYRADVRDKDINRQGEFIGFYVLSGLIGGVLVMSMLEVDHFWLANAIYLAFVVNAVTSSVVKLVAYRRGL